MLDICIIGAGQSGLTTCKTFVEKGYSVQILEKASEQYGMFATIKEKTLFRWSTSRYMSGFSDFPMPKEVPTWFTLQDYLDYLAAYAKRFDLDRHIQYNSFVKRCQQLGDGTWRIEYNNTYLLCKKLIVCTGLNQTPKFPEVINGFEGEVYHTEEIYRRMDRHDWQRIFAGKRVLLLGGAESALDIGNVLTKYTEKLYFSTKNYIEWFPTGAELEENLERVKQINNPYLTKTFDYNSTNYPTDTHLLGIEYGLPEPMSQLWHEYVRPVRTFLWGFDSECIHAHKKLCSINQTPNNIFKKNVVKRTEFILDLWENKASVVHYPEGVKGRTVFTKDGPLEGIDIIVCATGFRKQFPFLDPSILKDKWTKKMIPEHTPNVAFIGFARPTMGSIAAIAEMQSWWVEAWFRNALPSFRERSSWFRTIDPLNLKSDHIDTLVIGCYYLKDLAQDMKIEPATWIYFFTDQELYWKIILCSCHPMLYRLEGSKSYSEARETLLTTLPDSNKLSKNYIAFFFILHTIFIGILLSIAGLLAFFLTRSKRMKKQGWNLFVGISVLLLYVFYRFF